MYTLVMEREELLKRVASCWSWADLTPDDRLEYFGSISPDGYERVIQGTYHRLDNDHQDARMMIHMLDELERAGYHIDLRVAISELALDDTQEDTFGEYTSRPGWYEAWICYRKGVKMPRQEHYGKTRAHAVAEAFVACMEKK